MEGTCSGGYVRRSRKEALHSVDQLLLVREEAQLLQIQEAQVQQEAY